MYTILYLKVHSCLRETSGAWDHINDHISFIPLAIRKKISGLPLANKKGLHGMH